MEVGEEGDYIHYINMSSDENHFNVSLIVRNKVARQGPQTTTFLESKENRSGMEPRPFCLPAYVTHYRWAKPAHWHTLLRFQSKYVTMLLNVHRTIRLIRDGEKGGRGTEVRGEGEIIFLSLHCHHQNDSCIKMGSDESHFNVSVIMRDKVTRQCPQTTTFSERKESRSGIEPRPFCLPA